MRVQIAHQTPLQAGMPAEVVTVALTVEEAKNIVNELDTLPINCPEYINLYAIYLRLQEILA